MNEEEQKEVLKLSTIINILDNKKNGYNGFTSEIDTYYTNCIYNFD